MPITALPTPPLRTDPTNFSARGDAFLTALPTFVTEANATAAAMNLNSTTDTSASSVTVGLGAQTFSVSAGKSFQPGMWLTIASTAAPSTNAMNGTITSYSGTTLVTNIVSLMGSGTIAAWTISQSAPGGTANVISNTPAGNIAATNVQAALNELDVEKAALAGATFTGPIVVPAATLAGHAVGVGAIQAQTHTAYTTAGTATAYTITPSPVITAYAAGQSFFVTFNAVSGASPTIAISGIATPPNLVKQLSDGTYAVIAAGDIPINHRGQVTLLSPTQALVVLPAAKSGANTDITSLTGLTTGISGAGLGNKIQPITATVAASALTLQLSPTSLDFRSATLSSGTVSTRVVGTAITLVVPSTATLGTVNAVANRLVLIAIDNAGTVELAVVNISGGRNLDETTLISTTAISTAATSASVVYSTAARTNVAFRVVGYVESTQATAGTWATAPSTIQGCGGQALQHVGVILNATPIATTSGTSIDFTGIPSWAKRITVMFNGVSTTGTDFVTIRLGTGAGIEATGYTGSTQNMFTANTFQTTSLSTGIDISAASAANAHQGHIVIANFSGLTWVFVGSISQGSGGSNYQQGVKTLAGTLDRLRLTTSAGIDTFDAGSINILYE